MTNWQTKKLGEVATILMGQSPPSSTYNNKGEGLPFFQGKAEFGDLYPTINKFCSKPVRVAKEGDILLSVRAPVGPVNLAPCKVCIGRGLSAIRGQGIINQSFLFYFLKLNEVKLTKKGVGSTFSSISRKDIESLEIPIPPKSIQHKIVKRLDAIRKLQELNQQEIEKAEKLFSSSLYKFLKPKKDWQTKKIKQIAEVVRGASPRPKGDRHYFDGNIPWIKISDVTKNTDEKFLYKTAESLTEKGKEKSVYLESGSLIMTNSATVGLPKILAIDGCIHDGFLSFKNISSEILRDFLYYYLLSQRQTLIQRAPSGTQRNLNTGIVKNFQIFIPSISTQHKIVKRLDAIRDYQNSLKKQKEKLSELFESALNKAMKGELVS